jgi:hypothetical protein
MQTSWMAMFSLNMLRMSLELAKLMKFMKKYQLSFRHFLNIAWAMHHIGKKIFRFGMIKTIYYDVVEMSDGTERLKVRPWLVLFQCLLLKL